MNTCQECITQGWCGWRAKTEQTRKEQWVVRRKDEVAVRKYCYKTKQHPKTRKNRKKNLCRE